MNIRDSYFWNWLLGANKKKLIEPITYVLYLFILVYLFILFIRLPIYHIYQTSLDAYYRSPQGASAGYLYGYYPYAYHRGYYFG